MSDLPLPEPTPIPAEALDIQHDIDPAPHEVHARRIPHLGHALLFFSLAASCIFFFQVVILVVTHATTREAITAHAAVFALGEVLGYVLTFAIAVPLFAKLWQRSFLDGIHWTWRRARLHWWRLILAGFVLALLANAAERLIKSPIDSDIVLLLRTPLIAWVTAFTGSFIAPVVEEIAFRGFLLPALATAYDWISLERTPAGIQRWLQTTDHTKTAFAFAAVISSIGFALLHGMQLHGARGPLMVLFLVSMAFAAVRIVTRSVAASTIVHIAYNAFLFAELILGTGGFRHLEHLK